VDVKYLQPFVNASLKKCFTLLLLTYRDGHFVRKMSVGFKFLAGVYNNIEFGLLLLKID